MELKVKVWDKKFSEMVEANGLKWSERLQAFYPAPLRGKNGVWYEPFDDQCVTRLYTGLLDKNGVEIYEGDIFKTLSDRIGKVVFDRGAFVADIDEMSQESISYAADQQIEIIGNIYEHPNLLTETTGQ